MKNKLKLIDVNLLSMYTGRILTMVLALIVFGITLSALLDRGPRRSIISICVPARTIEDEHATQYEPFRALLSRQTRRPVALVARGDRWPQGKDLYVMAIGDYLQKADELGIVALCEIRSSERRSDSAVLFARSRDGVVDLADIAVTDVAFADPSSINRFWVQADALTRSGIDLPGRLDAYRFCGAGGAGARIIFGVLNGVYRLGACKLSDLTRLVDEGVLGSKEITVVHRDDAMPEMIIAAHENNASYYRKKLDNLGALLREPRSAATRDATVELSKSAGIAGLVPLTAPRMDRSRVLFEKYGAIR